MNAVYKFPGRAGWFVILMLAGLAFSNRGVAQTDAEGRARVHFQEGREHVEAARWDEAYGEFERGFELSGRPLFLFNMAECAREAGHTSRARRDYGRYLEAEPEGTHSASARERLAILGPEPEASVERAGRENTPAAASDAVDPSARPASEVVAVPPAALALDAASASERHVEVWEDWPFWTIVGVAVVVAAAVATSIGVVASEGAMSPCNTGCFSIDWR